MLLSWYTVVARIGVWGSLTGAGALAEYRSAPALGAFVLGIVILLAGMTGYLWNDD
ncbi:MAG TPA: hypothetical protein VGE12_06770 [Noviherbaspirillum sp.]